MSTTSDHLPDDGRPGWRRAPGLRIERHRATMAHLASVYPCHTDTGFGERGPYIGVNVTGGGTGFFFDPFELYPTHLTNPNVRSSATSAPASQRSSRRSSAASSPSTGRSDRSRSSTPKASTGRSPPPTGCPSSGCTPAAPTGSTQWTHAATPPRPCAGSRWPPRSSPVCSAGRLDPTEDAVLGWTITTLARHERPFTFVDVAATLANPAEELVALSRRTPLELTHAATPVVFALDKLLSRTLAGMFDGPTTVDIDWDNGPGFVIDLSAVYGDDEALPLVMLAATSWLSATLQRDSPRESSRSSTKPGPPSATAPATSKPRSSCPAPTACPPG